MNSKELLSFFEASDAEWPNLYVLGCYARRVTLYSQQVRALNLLYGLWMEERLRGGSKVAVIGGGAAGLMAAAGAAHLGAKVTIIDKFQSPMELQQNNRQRWIHPFVYDWPDGEVAGSRANLPLLDWEAGYAENVASQIEGRWRALASSPRYSIEDHWGVDQSSLFFKRHDGETFIAAPQVSGQPFDVVILGVGFGVEPENKAKSSYWSEDNIDGGFRADLHGQRWLVSGCGDGGLIDVMRLCIRRFRAEKIKSAFEQHGRVDSLKEWLRTIPKELREHPTAEKQEKYLSDAFKRLHKEYDLFDHFDRDFRRLNKPHVYLSGKGPSPYTPKASILNQLIICQLAKHQGTFDYIPGPSKVLRKKGAKFVVAFGEKGGDTREFDRVIERHGPEKALNDPCFKQFRSAFARLEARWSGVDPSDDPTGKRQWPPDFFEESSSSKATRDALFSGAVSRLGVLAESLSIVKEIRSDGSSTLSYQFNKLSVLTGNLTKIHFTFSTTAGSAGSFEFDSEGKRRGLRWRPEAEPEKGARLTGMIEEIRHLSGYIEFPEPLTPASPPASFGLSLLVLNGDALSQWEFSQMYAPEQRRHFNGDPLPEATEFLARVVWFPLEKLAIKLVLPDRISKPPYLTAFEPELKDTPKKEDVRRDDGTLEIYPPANSRWHPKMGHWIRLENPLLAGESVTRVASGSPQTCELEVTKPLPGSCYALDWPLNSPSPELDEAAESVAALRLELLRHRNARLEAKPGNRAVRANFRKLREKLAALFLPKPRDRFEVSVMAYDEAERSLRFVEAQIGAEPFPDSMKGTAFPFGIGLAGTCFKLGEIMYYQKSEENEGKPRIYLALPESPPREVLISVPIDHPAFSRERGRAAGVRQIP